MELFSEPSAGVEELRTSAPLTQPLYRTRPYGQPKANGLKHRTAMSKSYGNVETQLRRR
jgi:hypothetical protein